MKLFELKELVDKLFEVEKNRNLKVVASCGFDDLSYTGEATCCELAIWDDDGQCYSEEAIAEDDLEVVGESVIEIGGWSGD